jgi:hypothetical protein
MGAGTVAGLIYIERNEWSGWSDFRWELGEIFFLERMHCWASSVQAQEDGESITENLNALLLGHAFEPF